jgi:hypothetical protein
LKYLKTWKIMIFLFPPGRPYVPAALAPSERVKQFAPDPEERALLRASRRMATPFRWKASSGGGATLVLQALRAAR